jgi:YfiH family protein
MTLAQRLRAVGLDWLVPNWPVPGNVQALFTTRNGGTGTGAAATLDLGPAHVATLEAAERATVLANRDRVAAFLPSVPVVLEQVHGTHVATVSAATLDAMRDRPPVADAVVTRLPNVPLAVRVADCLPVLLADDAGQVVAIAHAGWRGLAAGVLEATVDAMNVEPAALAAWLGPSIGPGAFEVGEDVRDAFCSVDKGAAAHFAAIRPAKWMADLTALAAMRLQRAGVGRVASESACTFSDPARFFSYRRDRGTARMAAFVWRGEHVA